MSSRRRIIRRNLRTLAGLLAVFALIVIAYSALFQIAMLHEGQTHSWLDGFYWTMETMTTLGYGDIVFQSAAGRLFSVLVVGTGIVFLLILLPFSFVQFFYAPWLEARDAARAPRELAPDTVGHVILVAYGPVEAALIGRLRRFAMPYVVVVPDVAEALALHDQGVRVMIGDRDDPDTYRRARVDHAALVAATLADSANTNVVLTVREASASVPIVATAAWETSVDLLRHAGCQQVVQLGELLGRSMARRISGRGGRSHVIGQLDDLLIAEAAAAHTTLVGHTLRDVKLRERLNVNVAGVWERGRYVLATPETRITPDTLLLLSGSQADLDAYDAAIHGDRPAPDFAVIIGGGRVGRAASRGLTAAGIEHRIVERRIERVHEPGRYVTGDATDPAVLAEAGLDRAGSVAVTTHDDDANVYLTLYCRRLRPDMQILSRATQERNVSTLRRAGADYVLSYVPMEANAIFDVLRRGNLMLAAEGLDVFTVPVPRALEGRTIAESGLRDATGCNVLAVRRDGGRAAPPDPATPLQSGMQLVLVGEPDAERAFFERYGSSGA
jgi:voltage-gated potassium channel